MLAAPRVDDDELQMKEYQREYFDFLDDGKEQSIYINKVSQCLVLKRILVEMMT